MRASTPAATVVLLGLLVAALFSTPAAHAAKPAKAKACPKGTIVVGAAKAPTACVPQQPTSTAQTLQSTLAAVAKDAKGKTKPRGKRPSKRALQLLREVAAFAQARDAAGKPVFEAKPLAGKAGRLATSAPTDDPRAPGGSGAATRAQAGGNATITNAPASFGKQISAITDSSGMVTGGRFQAGDVSFTMNAESDGVKMEITDKSGAGGFMRFTPDSTQTPRCPSPAGDVPSKFETRMTFGQYTIDDGYRYVTATTVLFDGPWHGYVGVGAKAEKFDVNASGAVEIRIHVEDRKTGKIVFRDGTRVYRAVLDRKGLPIATTGASLVGGARFFGPKGGIKSALDRTVASALGQLVVTHIDLVPAALKDGDTRWYDNMRCARVGLNQYEPSEVRRGDTAKWTLDVTNEPGERAADAQWTFSSTCGAPSPAAPRGNPVSVSVADAASAWGPDPYAPACIKAEVTSTAGRAATFTHEIPPKKPDGYRFTIKLTYDEQMGPGIAATNAHGSGSVFLRWDADKAEGSGTYDGTEWDGTIGNPCGDDMLATRSFGGTATVGVTRNDDGTFTVAWVANERPLRMSWLEVVTAEGATITRKHRQPFCGQAGLAATTANLTIGVQAVPAE